MFQISICMNKGRKRVIFGALEHSKPFYCKIVENIF
jgi:hypothetical protein